MNMDENSSRNKDLLLEIIMNSQGDKILQRRGEERKMKENPIR
jgi:hypothetical protein